jgi:hypothetical protein
VNFLCPRYLAKCCSLNWRLYSLSWARSASSRISKICLSTCSCSFRVLLVTAEQCFRSDSLATIQQLRNGIPGHDLMNFGPLATKQLHARIGPEGESGRRWLCVSFWMQSSASICLVDVAQSERIALFHLLGGQCQIFMKCCKTGLGPDDSKTHQSDRSPCESKNEQSDIDILH